MTGHRIDSVYEKSKQVLESVSLENGAIVAADTDSRSYPPDAKPYRYVWPRDAAYICVACDYAGLEKIPEAFFKWCINRACDVKEEGVFKESYYTNGSPLKMTGFHQLDHTGSLLWAIHHHFGGEKPQDPQILELLQTLAGSLCGLWMEDHFKIPGADLWEEHVAWPDVNQNHLYTLAACSTGLKLAGEMLGESKYLEVSTQMSDVISNIDMDVLPRTIGEITDNKLDASLLGLKWPFIVTGIDDKLGKTIARIQAKLVDEGGIHRYLGDRYDACRKGSTTRKMGAGRWPLLNLWMSIVLQEMGEQEKARGYLKWVLENTSGYLPEQVFKNEVQASPKPLAWAHALMIIALKKLSLK